MMGGLAATYVTASTPVAWTVAGATTELQAIIGYHSSWRAAASDRARGLGIPPEEP